MFGLLGCWNSVNYSPTRFMWDGDRRNLDTPHTHLSSSLLLWQMKFKVHVEHRSHRSRWTWTMLDFCFTVPVHSFQSIPRGTVKRKAESMPSLSSSFRELACIWKWSYPEEMPQHPWKHSCLGLGGTPPALYTVSPGDYQHLPERQLRPEKEGQRANKC